MRVSSFKMLLRHPVPLDQENFPKEAKEQRGKNFSVSLDFILKEEKRMSEGLERESELYGLFMHGIFFRPSLT